MTETPYPDAEAVVLDIVDPVAPGAVYTELPEEFPAPAVRVTRTGGSDNGVSDFPVVEVTSVGATRAQAWQMDGQVRQLIQGAGGTTVNGVLVDSTRTVTPSQQLPDPRGDVRVVTSSYRLGFRRQS